MKTREARLRGIYKIGARIGGFCPAATSGNSHRQSGEIRYNPGLPSQA